LDGDGVHGAVKHIWHRIATVRSFLVISAPLSVRRNTVEYSARTSDSVGFVSLQLLSEGATM
jgi:hypothetical protein